MKKEEVFLRQNAIKIAIMCVEAMHADNTTLDPIQEADHFDVMKPLYRILGELDNEAQAFVDADLHALKTTYSNLIHTYEDEGKPTPEIDLSDFGKIFSDGDVSF